MPILAVSCSRKAISKGVKSDSEDSSITALTWLSNSTGSTMMLLGVTLSSAELIGAALRTLVISLARPSAAHCPTSPSPTVKDVG